MSKLETYMNELGQQSREGFDSIRLASTAVKQSALRAMADAIIAAKNDIIAANNKDMAGGKEKSLSGAMLDRLMLDEKRINAIADSLRSIADLPDPVGQVDENWEQPNGLKFSRMRIPIGVIGMIYESRPNVTADAGALSLWSGNACILRGGSEAAFSNEAIHDAMMQALDSVGLSRHIIQRINTTDRAAVGELLGGLGGTVDLIIPRGGKGLVERVQTDARVPVLAHLEGLNHTYIHKNMSKNKAINIVSNAKMRRTGVCGSTETVLIDIDVAADVLPDLVQALQGLGCEVRGCERTQSLELGTHPASEIDFHTEHLAPILNVKIVDNIDATLAHIAGHGSGHTDAIITEDEDAARKFLSEVDSAIVMHNTSTQFADGGEFGFGAEIGIATGRLHARGPVGAKHLTTYKYVVEGNGQVRP